MSQPTDVAGQWVALKQAGGLWEVRNRQTGLRVAQDLAEPDAIVIAQAPAMLEAIKWYVADLDEFDESYGMRAILRAIEEA